MSDPLDGGSDYMLVVEFPDQSPSFAYGVEVGKLWEQMKRDGATVIESTTMFENREVIRRIAAYLGWEVEFRVIAEGWDDTAFTKVRPQGQKINPRGLRVVPK